MKTITLKVDGTSQSQWSTFVLELNIMKKDRKRYGVEVELKAPSISKIIKLGNTHGEKENKLKKRKNNHIINVFR